MQPTTSASDEVTQVRRSYRVRTTNNPGWAVTGDPTVKATQYISKTSKYYIVLLVLAEYYFIAGL